MKVMQVIQAEVLRGEGTIADVHRKVVQYFTVDGTFLAENDPYPPQQSKLPKSREEYALKLLTEIAKAGEFQDPQNLLRLAGAAKTLVEESFESGYPK